MFKFVSAQVNGEARSNITSAGIAGAILSQTQVRAYDRIIALTVCLGEQTVIRSIVKWCRNELLLITKGA